MALIGPSPWRSLQGSNLLKENRFNQVQHLRIISVICWGICFFWCLIRWLVPKRLSTFISQVQETRQSVYVELWFYFCTLFCYSQDLCSWNLDFQQSPSASRLVLKRTKCQLSSMDSFFSCLAVFTMSAVTHVEKNPNFNLLRDCGWWTNEYRLGWVIRFTSWL